MINMQETEQPKKEKQKAVYDTKKLKTALQNFQYNPQARKQLGDFIADYEADPVLHKDLKGMYESIKTKLK
jgi:aromatic ring-opening dioxygenase catalytic subunit (LigB family)